jgi:aromatic ring-opening dioxygenase catalytic subunit (LigB family)
MGEIVFAAALSHAPGITAYSNRAPEPQRRRFFAALEEARRSLERARPHVVVVATSDHFTNLFLTAMPAFCIGLAADYTGPVEKWVGLEQRRFRGAPAFARDLLRVAFDTDLDPAFAERLQIEYSIMTPLHFLTPRLDLPIVPILQNCQVPPLPSLRRCYTLGGVIREVARQRSERVAVIGTGGLSHAPGTPEDGRIDEEFDRGFLQLLERRDDRAVLELPNARVDAAGYGTWEIRQWTLVMGAAPGRRANVLAYEPVQEWETGCAVALFE